MSRAKISEVPAVTSISLIAGVVLVLVFARPVLIPLAFALTLSFLLMPAVAMLERRRVGRNFAVSVVTSLTCIGLLAACYILSRQVLTVATMLPGYRANMQHKIDALHSSSERSLVAAVIMIEDLSRGLTAASGPDGPQAVQVQVVGDRSDQLQATIRLAGSILQPFTQIAIVIIFTIYMLIYREDLRNRLLLLAGMGNINAMTQAFGDASERISRFLVTQLQVNACYGVLFGLGIFLVHVPEATLWGAVAGTLRIIPYVGPLMGLVIPLILSVAASSSWWPPLLVLALFLLLETSVANFVEPWLFSSRTGISSLALLASAIFWSMLWGWPGLVLSTPLTVCVVVIGRYVPQFSFLHNLLGKNATLSPPAQVYERLLVMDQTQAWAVAENYLDGKPLVKLYDTVILPVLSLAEEDRYKGVLDDVRWNFVLLSIGELVARLSGYTPIGSTGEEMSTRSRIIAARRAELQKECAVVCISSGGKPDELVTAMLCQLLEGSGYQTLILHADAISDEILAGLAAERDTMIFVSALPPFAFARTRALCHRMRNRLPENRIAAALWQSSEDAEELLGRFGSAQPDAVVSTLGQSIVQVEAWQRATPKV